MRQRRRTDVEKSSCGGSGGLEGNTHIVLRGERRRDKLRLKVEKRVGNVEKPSKRSA